MYAPATKLGSKSALPWLNTSPVEGIERSSNLFLVWSVKNGLFHNLRPFMVVLVVVCVVAVIVYCWPSLPRTESNRDHAIPDGIERGKEGKRQYRPNGRASDQHRSHKSPEHGVRERDKCKHRGQCRQ